MNAHPAAHVAIIPLRLTSGSFEEIAKHSFSSERSSSAPSPPKRPAASILIVDDDANIRALVEDLLRYEGYDVRTAANGAEALVEIGRETPGLVLLDMRMPVQNGWEFSQNLNARGIHIPTIVVSATSDVIEWANQVRAEAALAKPFDLVDLLALIEALFG